MQLFWQGMISHMFASNNDLNNNNLFCFCKFTRRSPAKIHGYSVRVYVYKMNVRISKIFVHNALASVQGVQYLTLSLFNVQL